MARLGKWIGGGLGWALGGPVGMVIGFALGTVLDSTTAVTTYQSDSPPQPGRRQTTSGDFAMSLLVVSAAVMKADGKVMRSELEYVKEFFRRSFGERQSSEMMLMLRGILSKEIHIPAVCAQIRSNMTLLMRLQLLHYLFGIAGADGAVSAEELSVITQIAGGLGIPQKDFDSIKAMFVVSNDSAYEILEITREATDEEVKKAYRKMAVKYHPDKLTQLGEEYQKGATEKFQEVQNAYERIRKERGIK